jgi:hypothetical protein
MVCTKCGALIPDDAFACPSCARPMRVRELLESPPALAAAGKCRGVEGWLAFLVFYLVFLLPLGSGMGLVRDLRPQLAGGLVHKGASLSDLVYWVVSLFVTGLGIYAGIALWRVFPTAVLATKRFLIVLLITGVVVSTVRYHTLEGRIWGMADALTFFSVWYAYLNLSKRVANTYPRHAGSATLPT